MKMTDRRILQSRMRDCLGITIGWGAWPEVRVLPEETLAAGSEQGKERETIYT